MKITVFGLPPVPNTKTYLIKFYMVAGKREDMDEVFFDCITQDDVNLLRLKLFGKDTNPWWRPQITELDQVELNGWEEWVNLNNVESITIEEDKN